MKRRTFLCLRPGDLVRHKGRGEAMIVTRTEGNLAARSVMAVRSVMLTNPDEWDRVDEHGKVIE